MEPYTCQPLIPSSTYKDLLVNYYYYYYQCYISCSPFHTQKHSFDFEYLTRTFHPLHITKSSVHVPHIDTTFKYSKKLPQLSPIFHMYKPIKVPITFVPLCHSIYYFRYWSMCMNNLLYIFPRHFINDNLCVVKLYKTHAIISPNCLVYRNASCFSRLYIRLPSS